MAKHPSVNKYRSGVKNPHKEVHVYDDGALVRVHVVDWRAGKVTSMDNVPKVAVEVPVERKVAVEVPVSP